MIFNCFIIDFKWSLVNTNSSTATNVEKINGKSFATDLQTGVITISVVQVMEQRSVSKLRNRVGLETFSNRII